MTPQPPMSLSGILFTLGVLFAGVGYGFWSEARTIRREHAAAINAQMGVLTARLGAQPDPMRAAVVVAHAAIAARAEISEALVTLAARGQLRPSPPPMIDVAAYRDHEPFMGQPRPTETVTQPVADDRGESPSERYARAWDALRAGGVAGRHRAPVTVVRATSRVGHWCARVPSRARHWWASTSPTDADRPVRDAMVPHSVPLAHWLPEPVTVAVMVSPSPELRRRSLSPWWRDVPPLVTEPFFTDDHMALPSGADRRALGGARS